MNDVLEQVFGAPVIPLCQDTDRVYEIYSGFNMQGSIQKGTFVPTAQTGTDTNCPSKIKYPPKN
jgi:ribonuclease T2